MNAIIQHSVLIVSGTQKGAAYITELLSPREFAPMTTALSGGDARRLLLRRSYDLVVINTPLPDEFGHELAEYITEKFVSGVMVIAKAELFDQVNDKMEPFGILTVQKPLSRPLFYQACSSPRRTAGSALTGKTRSSEPKWKKCALWRVQSVSLWNTCA